MLGAHHRFMRQQARTSREFSAPLPGDRPARSRSLITRFLISGGALSLFVHALVLLLAALIPIRFAALGGAKDSDGEIEVAVLTESELAELTADSISDGAPDLPDLESLVDVNLEPLEASPDVPAIGDQPLEVDLDIGGGDIGDIGELSELGAGGVTASFFGLEAQGTRFAYIVDISSSMRSGDKWTRTRTELLRSISQLPENGRFLVAFYSDGSAPLFDQWSWSDATDRIKRRAGSTIRRVEPSGGTQPSQAFTEIFGMSPPPEAIYFMTDGRIPEGVPGLVSQLNRRERIPVHCVFFGDSREGAAAVDDAKSLLLRISRESGGRFTDVDAAR